VGGGSSTNWNAAGNTNWALISGGANNAAVPAAGDDVFFDANSGTAGAVVNVSTNNLKSFNMSNCPGAFTLSGASSISVVPASGTVTCLFGGTVTWTGVLTLQPASGSTVNFTSAGNTLRPSNTSGTGTIQQQDDLTVGQQGSGMTVTGTWVTNNHNITFKGQTSATNGAFTNNGTFTAGTGTVTFDGTNFGANIFGTSDCSFNNLTITGAANTQAQFSLQSNQTVTGTLTLTGANKTTQRLWCLSKTPGTQVELTVQTQSASLYSNVDFQDFDLHCAGGRIDLSNITGLSGDCGGNSATDMKLAAGGTNVFTYNLSATNVWSTQLWSLGRPPLPQDNVVGLGALTGSLQLQLDTVRLGRNVDLSAITTDNTSPVTNTTGAGFVVNYGNFLLPASILSWGGGLHQFLYNGTYTNSTSNLFLNGTWDCLLKNSNLSLLSNFKAGSIGNIGMQGDATSSFNDNGYSVNLTAFTTTNSAAGFVLTMSGTWTLTGTNGTFGVWTVPAGVTLNAAGSTLLFTDATASAKTVAGGGHTYGNLAISGAGTGSWTFTGANTFNDFRDSGTGTHTLTFPGSTTTTCTSFHVTGTSGHLITLAASAGSFTLSVAAAADGGVVSCDFLSISHSTATGGATFYAGGNSTNGGSNSGWTFTAAPNATAYTLVGPGRGYYRSASGNFSVDLDGPAGGSVTVTPASSGAGTFSPTSLSWTAGQSQTQTFTYTPTSTTGSPHSLSVSSGGALTDPPALNYTVSAIRLTVTAVVAAKRYDGTTTALTYGGAAAVPIITLGALAGGDTANFTEAYATAGNAAAVTSQVTLIPSGVVTDGNGGANYNVTFVTLSTGVILPSATAPPLPTLNWPAGFSDWLNVKRAPYNAKGDGFTDDTTAINNAISDMMAGGASVRKAVYLPAGTYLISSTLSILGPSGNQNGYGVRVFGNGAATVIKWGGAAGGTMMSFQRTGYLQFNGFVLDANGLAGICLDTNSAAFQTSCYFRNLGFQNYTNTTGGFGYGVNLRGSSATADSLWLNCYWRDGKNGVVITGFNTLNHLFYGCDFRGHSNRAISCTNGNFHCYDSHFELNDTDFSLVNAGGAGISLVGCSSRGANQFIDKTTAGLTVEDCWVDSWTGTVAAGTSPIVQHGLPVLMFDATFTNPPTTDPPVYLQATSDVLMTSNVVSAATTAVYLNPAGDTSIYAIQSGVYGGVLTGADATGFKTSFAIPPTVFDVTTYGAKGDDVADDTTAIQNAINAAVQGASAGAGAIVYFPNPSSKYKVKSTLHLQGSNYWVWGGGWHCYLDWKGSDAAGQKMFWLDTLANVTFADFQWPNALAHAYNVYVSGKTTCRLDRLWLNSLGANASATAPGLYLDTLPAGSTVNGDYLNGNITIHDCGSAKVITKFLETAGLVVEGTSSVTLGNLGALVFDGGSSVSTTVTLWQINDGQSYACSTFYVEQVPANNTMVSTTGGQANTMVTVAWGKAEVNAGTSTVWNTTNATANTPQINFFEMNAPSGGSNLVFDFTNTGTGAVLFVSAAGKWVQSNTITLSGTVNTTYKGNAGATAPADTSGGTDAANISAGLDHLRLLRLAETSLQATPTHAGYKVGGRPAWYMRALAEDSRRRSRRQSFDRALAASLHGRLADAAFAAEALHLRRGLEAQAYSVLLADL
jgi:hypothetical protein